MIVTTSIRDPELLKLVQDALMDILIHVPLAGLTYLGEAIRIEHDEAQPTMCTDGRVVWVSKSWMLRNGKNGNIFDLLHEWVHVFNNHVRRRGDRDKKIWNVAGDIVAVDWASEMLGRKEWPPPKDGVIPPHWAQGLTAEQIYDKLLEQEKRKKKEEEEEEEEEEVRLAGDFKYTSVEEYSNFEEVEFKRKFVEELAQAALVMEQVKKEGVAGTYGEAIASRFKELLKGRIPWSRLYRGDLIDTMTREYATWSPPRRKYFADLILPTYRSYKERKLVIGIDVSASVGEALENEFIANVIPAAMRAETTIIVVFDQVVRECVYTKHPKEILKKVKFLQGSHSHTDCRGVFEVVDKEKPSGVTVLTDGHVILPDTPYHDTLWCIPQGGNKPPWGRTYVMDVSW